MYQKYKNIKQIYNLTDEQLIEGCIRKDAQCQKAVFDRYGSKLLGVSVRYARNNADAEDILQDAFIKVFEKINQFRHEGSFEGWMRRIVVNVALKKYKVLRYSSEQTDKDIAEHEDIIHNDASAYAHLSEKDLLKLINELPDGYRLIFNMYVIEGYKHEEIAALLQINAGTSRSQLAKARNLLQKQILQLQRVAV